MTMYLNQMSNQSKNIQRHPQGSVLILVVAVLVMLVLIGTVLLQTARNDRFATAQLNNNHIDEVGMAEFQNIITKLTKDVVIKSNYLSDDEENGETNEPFDYPGEDDLWLASTWPVNGKWPQMTDIRNTTGTVRTNYQDQIVAEPASGSTLADADGDGIVDSRWVTALLSRIKGVDYKVAIRIIDNSSLLNINVATSLRDNTGAFDATEMPYFWYPTDLDLSNFIYSRNGTLADVTKLMQYRTGKVTVDLPTKWDRSSDSDSRYFLWLHGARMFWNPNAASGGTTSYQMYSLGDEFELRARNGLNSPDSFVSIDSQLKTFFRDNTDEKEVQYNSSPSPVYTLNNYFTNEPRHQLTTISGCATLYPDWKEDGGLHYQTDINEYVGGAIPNDVKLTELATEVKEILDKGTFTDVYRPEGLRTPKNTQQIANQFAASLRDYTDKDNRLTKVGTGLDTRYGMEALPAITEAYVQYDYKVEEEDDGSGGKKKVYKKQGHAGFVIEIRNPHPFDISLDNLWVHIADIKKELSTLVGSSALQKGNYLVIYRNTDSGDGTQENVLTSTGTDGATVKGEWTDTTPFNGTASGASIEIQLFAAGSDGAELNFPYQKVSVQALENKDSYDVVSAPNEPAVDKWFYKHASTIGSGDGINALLITSSKFTRGKHNVGDTDVPGKYNGTLEALGDADKIPKGGPGSVCDSTKNQILLRNDPDNMLRHIGDIAQVLILGPTEAKTFAERWNGLGDTPPAPPAILDPLYASEKFMLDFTRGSARPAADTKVTFKIPHAIAIADRFTTLDPHTDKVDNNGDGQKDELGERFIPGRINLNTVAGYNGAVPANHLLMQCLPLPNDLVRQNVVKAILDFRDAKNAGDRPAGWRVESGSFQQGLVSTGELMAMKALRDAYSSGAPIGTWKIDKTPVTAAVDDGITGDREEQAYVYRWLSQLCTTRSDIFTAYIQVRGERNGRLVEQRRYIAIFDRSGLADSTNGQVRLIGLMKN